MAHGFSQPDEVSSGALESGTPARATVVFTLTFALALALLGFANCCFGDVALQSVNHEYCVKVWESDQAGRPTYCVTSFAQTPDGFLWLGGFDRLSRFDGTHYTHFNRTTLSQLPSDMARCLFVDHLGALWVGTDKGIARMKDGQWGTFSDTNLFSGNDVDSFAERPDGVLFACAGSNLLEFAKDRFVVATGPERDVEDLQLNWCGFDSRGTLWVKANSYLGSLQNGKWTSVAVPEGGSIAGTAICREGGLWVSTVTNLYRYQDGKWSHVLKFPEEFVEANRTLMEDSQGNLWVGGFTKGVLALMKNGEVLRCTTEDGLGNSATLSLFEDREGHIWIGSNGGGLARLRARSVETYDDKNGLQQLIINCLMEDAPGRMLVGTHGGGLTPFCSNRFDAALTSPQINDSLNRSPLQAGSWIYSLAKDHSGTVWIGTYADGLFRLRDGRVEQFPLIQARHDTVRCLFVDSRDRLWIGTERTLVCRDNEKLLSGPDLGFPATEVWMIGEDDEGRIWAADSGSHLLRQNGATFEPAQLFADTNAIVTTMYTGRDRTLWIAGTSPASSGKTLTGFRGGEAFAFTEKQGLPAVSLNNMVEDDDGNLWFGTSGGVLRITRASLAGVSSGAQDHLDCLMLGDGDGMRTVFCRDGVQPGCCKDSAGRLWFATLKGVAMVDPRNVRVRSETTPAKIESIEVNGNLVPLSSDSCPQFVAPAGTTHVTIRYTAVSLGASEPIRFQYRRQDANDQWMDAGTERMAEFYDLSPGDYQLTVRAANREFSWSDDTAIVSFAVRSYLWQRASFKAIAVGVLVAIVSGLMWRFQTVRARRAWILREKENALAQERAHSADLAKATASAQNALSRFEAVIENAPLVAIQGYDCNGAVLHWNAASQALYGFSRQEALRQQVFKLLSGECGAEFEGRLREILLTQKPSAPSEWSIRTRNGEQRFVYSSMFPLFHEGKLVEIFCMDLDITKRKELEQELRQAQKMEAVGQLAGGVAHDFNNVLTIILGHVGVLQSLHPELSTDVTESIDEIGNAAERCANLTRQLLTFSRRQVLMIKPIDLNVSLKNLSRMLRRTLGEHISLSFHYAQDSAWVTADQGMLEQIVLNLSINARDAMPNGGTLAISTSVVEVDAAYTRPHPDARTGSFVCLSVTDNGCGIDSAVIPRIFEPFFTTKEVGKGTGLGLATVYGIVKQHRGWVEVQSEIGKGSTFKVWLPVCSRIPKPQQVRSRVLA